MEKVKRLVDAGAKPATAIKEALGMSVTEFADLYELPRGTTSEVINSGRKPTAAQLKALSKHLGGTPAQWADFLWKAGKPVPVGI
jgi:plasmid maintenance system antidote protein VapI